MSPVEEDVASLPHLPSVRLTSSQHLTILEDEEQSADDAREGVPRMLGAPASESSLGTSRKSVLRSRHQSSPKLSSMQSGGVVRPKVKMWVKFRIFNVLWIDTVAQSFRAKFSLESTWEDPSLNKVTNVDVGEVWKPRRVKLVNEIESEFSPTYEVCTWEKNQRSDTVMTCYFNCSGSFITKMDLRMFPFDYQDLKVSFTMMSRDKDIEFMTNPFRESGFDYQNFMLHEWSPVETVGEFEYQEENRLPLYHINIRLKRRAGYYVTNVALPLFLITILTWLGYAIPVTNTGSRLEAILTLVLTSVAFKFVVAGHLPPLSYNTLCDYYVIFSLLFQVAIAVQIGVTPLLFRSELDGEGAGGSGAGPTERHSRAIATMELIDMVFALALLALYALMHLTFVVVIKRNNISKDGSSRGKARRSAKVYEATGM